MSVLLGIVEGLTEFLPVSSTAHLRIAEALMKLPMDDAYWKMYTIVIQLGAIIAVIAWAMLIGGVVMWIIDARSSRLEPITNEVEEMGLGQAIWIGLCQT